MSRSSGWLRCHDWLPAECGPTAVQNNSAVPAVSSRPLRLPSILFARLTSKHNSKAAIMTR